MKWLARAGLVALMALLAAGGVVNVAALRSLPQLDGELHLKGLGANVQVSRDAADVTHIGLRAAVGAGDCFIQVTLTAAGKTVDFSGNAKEMSDADRTAKNYGRVTWKMHCNTVPVIADVV